MRLFSSESEKEEFNAEEAKRRSYLQGSLKLGCPMADMETSSLPTSHRMPTPLKAILVEDNQTIRDSLVPALAEMANTEIVAWAATAVQAKHALSEWHGRWQLVIVDLFLAAGSGLEVLLEVKNRGPGQYAFVLSNYATDEMRRRSLELGANGVFDKSTEIDVFMDRCLAIERT